MSIIPRLLALLLCQLFIWVPLAVQAVVINEIRIDQPGPDRDEYFELAGAPGASLDGLSYLVIGDGRGGSGVVEAAVALRGQRLSTAGFFLAAEGSFALGPAADLRVGLNFENSDNVTHLLVRDFSGAILDDLDSDDDGVLDVRPWSAVLDSVALVEDLLRGERVYSETVVGPLDGEVPAHVYRDPDVDGAWQAATAWGEDTPGSARRAGSRGGDDAMSVDEPPLLWLLGLGIVLLLCCRRGARDSAAALLQHGAGGGHSAAAVDGGLQGAQHVVQGMQA
ncbi:MAG: hypothetical protein ACE5ET_05765 [Gammaproteobacteria bacterium]